MSKSTDADAGLRTRSLTKHLKASAVCAAEAFQTVKKGCRPQKQHKFRKRMARYRFFSFYFLKMRLALRANAFAFCVVRLLPYPQTKQFEHRRFFGKTARRSALLPSARHALSMPRSGVAPLIRAVYRKSSIGNEKIFFVWKVEDRSHTGVWQGMRQTKRRNIPFQERCCPNRFV